MKRARGFTLVEMALVIGIMLLLAAITVAGTRAFRSNATLAGSVLEMQLLLQGQQPLALAEQRDHVYILVNGDVAQCSLVRQDRCTRYYLLAAPDPAAWTFAAFDPANPGLNVGEVIDKGTLEKVYFYTSATGKKGPDPFARVTAFDPVYTGKCGGDPCVAYRFKANGEVDGEMQGGGTPGHGNLIVLSNDLQGETGAAARNAILVGFPNGIVKTYPY
jgi:prepilin-type N-terminal cleavage/methylation domain-containing protein